jgi:hypothetical protein
VFEENFGAGKLTVSQVCLLLVQLGGCFIEDLLFYFSNLDIGSAVSM